MSIRDNVLELTLQELQKKYNKICQDYDSARIKILTLFGGGLVFLSFLYSGKDASGRADIFFPPNMDGRIFYIIGLALFLGALCIFFWAIRPSMWAMPTEASEIARLEERYNTRNKFLIYLKDEYTEAIEFCMKQHEHKVKLLDIGTTMLFIGAIILLVLKYFGG
jgi:hypothetical protein